MCLFKFSIRTFDHLRRDTAGLAITSELVLFATIAVVGLIAGSAALRDSVVSELSDIGGAVQDLRGDYEVNGITGSSSMVAGMSYNDSTDSDDLPDDQPGFADNCVVFDEPPSNEENPVVVLEPTAVGPGAGLAAANLDTDGIRLNIEPEFALELDAGTYDVQGVAFAAESNGDGEVRAFLAVEDGGLNYETIWVSDALVPGGGRTDFEIDYAAGTEQFTLTSTDNVFAGIWQDGDAKVYFSNLSTTTNHDIGSIQPTAVGQTISDFSHGNLGDRTYIYEVTIGSGN